MKTKITKDLVKMAVTISGQEFALTLKPDHDTFKLLALHGFQQKVSDCVAGMTVKAGYTPEERLAKMTEVSEVLNAGTWKVSKGERVVSPAKAIEKVQAMAKPAGMTDKEFVRLQELLAKAAGAMLQERFGKREEPKEAEKN